MLLQIDIYKETIYLGIKLIALDLDDTLLNEDCQISERNQQAIVKAVQQGVAVTVATGRPFITALPFAKQLNLDVPLIVYNGALIKTSLSEEILFYQPVPPAVAAEIFSLAEKAGWFVQVYLNDNFYVKELNHWTESYAKIAKIEPIVVGNDVYKISEPAAKIMIRGRPEELPLIRDELSERFPHKFSMAISHPTFLEITDCGVNKGAALSKLAARLGIDREEVMAVGDSGNDVAMLKFAQWSFAVANASAEAKKAARFQTGRNTADGVAEAIEKYVLH